MESLLQNSRHGLAGTAFGALAVTTTFMSGILNILKNTNVNGGMDWLEIAYRKVKKVLCQS